MTRQRRPSLAVYWAAGCGGCETTFLDLGSGLLRLQNDFELVFFPMLVDTKISAIEAMGERAIDLCLFTGAVRSTHDAEMARLFRQRSKTLVAFGACAQLASVLALADVDEEIRLFDSVYGHSPSTDAVTGTVLPGQETWTDGGVLRLPKLYPFTRPLAAVVPVDYAVPGCPPEAPRVAELLELLARGSAVPEAFAVLGATSVGLCEECARRRPEGPIPRFARLHEVTPDPERCLLDQGLMCCGPVTRGGCGALCPGVGVGCGGCYGPLPAVEDVGARMVGVLAALMSPADPARGDVHLRSEIDELAGDLVDPIGTLYRYCYADSLLFVLGTAKGEPPCDG